MSQTGSAGQAGASLWGLTTDMAPVLPRHRHGFTREQVRHSQEVRLRVATVEEVAAHGYAGASVRQIAARAGISTKTFYELYPDKESAFLATYVAVELVTEQMRAAAGDARTAAGVIDAGVRTYLGTLASQPAFTQSLVVEAVASTDRIRARRTQGLADFAGVVVQHLRRVRGPAGPDPAATLADHALLIGALGAVNELVVQHLGSATAATLLDIVDPARILLERIVLTAKERSPDARDPH
ncbi:TetR/AcrR family transcriptional regulator [Mycobacteroides abscessus]|uniref:TetR/AcrR family transcriptional regulator n=1 Tax=Mycobacteroides abscessus TaxID=36809 RepID=UPI0012FEBE14|nr:TetR/AcrR family transcriptional regulator [Mycobacteroides abscessus]